MNTKDVENAVKFSIEDIEDSLDCLDDGEYIDALCQIEQWCRRRWLDRSEQVRNAGGRA